MTDITNGQVVDASFDLFDQKSVAYKELPAGSKVEVTGGDDGGPNGVAQWADKSSAKSTITTQGDQLGQVSFKATLTLADGTVMESSNSIDINVINSAPGSFVGTVGVPRDEEPAPAPAPDQPPTP